MIRIAIKSLYFIDLFDSHLYNRHWLNSFTTAHEHPFKDPHR